MYLIDTKADEFEGFLNVCQNRICTEEWNVANSPARRWKKWRSNAHTRANRRYRDLSEKQQDKLQNKLRAARQEAGLNQIEAGERVGQDQTFISKIESGTRQVKFVEVEQLAELYGRPLSFFATIDQKTTQRGRK
jgi:ribosome-binding protein aMBF1 (putative translation factor)